MSKQEQFARWLNDGVRPIITLERVMDRLHLDQETLCPPANYDIAGQERAHIAGIHARLLTDPAFVATTQSLLAEDGLNIEQRACVVAMHRQIERMQRIPKEILVAIEAQSALLGNLWRDLRSGGGSEAEYLQQWQTLVTLKREQSRAMGIGSHPYDAMLDEFDPGSRTAELLPLLQEQVAIVRPLLSRVLSQPQVPTGILELPYPPRRVVAFAKRVICHFGLRPSRARFLKTHHQQMAGLSMHDVRIMLRRRFPGQRSAHDGVMHEGGHGIYEQGFHPKWWHTPMARAISIVVHESQSLWFERFLGHSRSFWQWCFPLFRDQFLKLGLDTIPLETGRPYIQPLLNFFATRARRRR